MTTPTQAEYARLDDTATVDAAGTALPHGLTLGEVRTINQAAAHLDGVLACDAEYRGELARRLFAIAGNPLRP